jgi:RNA polymerase-binding transcription factor DksA
MTKQHEVERTRRRLEASLREAVDSMEERDSMQIEWEPELAARAAAADLRELAIFQVDHHAHIQHDVEAALDRLDRGRYGVCEVCEHPIAQSRLRALPYARLCCKCQRESETRAHDHLN